MVFWTDAQLRDPKRVNKWYITHGRGAESPLNGVGFWAKKVTRPKFTVNEAEHAYIDFTMYFPGRVKWEPVTITVVDPTEPDVMQELMRIFESSGYRIPANANSLSTIGKRRAVESLGALTIHLFTEDGKITETWRLRNAWAKNFTPVDLDYTSDELITYDLEIRYDWAEGEMFDDNGQSKGKLFVPR